jgi:hypothetical protein
LSATKDTLVRLCRQQGWWGTVESNCQAVHP